MKTLLVMLMVSCLSAMAQVPLPVVNEQYPAYDEPAPHAHVIALTPDETKQAQYYADTVAAAKQALADFNNGIAQKYIMKEIILPSAASICIMPGQKDCTPPPIKTMTDAEKKKNSYWVWKDDWWENGFDYDESYHFITPKVTKSSNNCVCGSNSFNCACYAVPSTGGGSTYRSNGMITPNTQ